MEMKKIKFFFFILPTLKLMKVYLSKEYVKKKKKSEGISMKQILLLDKKKFQKKIALFRDVDGQEKGHHSRVFIP